MKIRSITTPVSINSNDLSWQIMPDQNCQHQGLPEELGAGCSRMFTLNQDFSCIETEYTPIRNLAIVSHMQDSEPRMVLTLALKGCSGFNDDQGNEVAFKAGVSTLTTFTNCKGVRHYQDNQTVNQLRFSMTKHWLEQHFGAGSLDRIWPKNSMRVVSQRPISLTAIQVAHYLQANSFSGESQTLFRQGLAMAIVASELNDLIENSDPQVHRLSERDKKLAEMAREILQAEFANPPSVEELCRRLATNQFKLKQLFRYQFDTTPYGMLLDIRMKKAYHLLSTGHFPVTLAAEAVGYQHVSNFSAAFHKYYGFSPKRVLRQT